MLDEQVGECCICGQKVYCRGGFLDGIVGENQEVYCFSCAEGEI